MPRKHEGRHHTTKQKGRPMGGGTGTYSRLKKSRKADLYDRPYLTGTYRKEGQ